MKADCIIEFRNVHKAFGDNSVYTGLDLCVHRGETITVIGGSGSGKSVLLKILIGLIEPDEGEVWFDGERVTSEKQLFEVRKRVSMLFQGAALFDSMPVAENIAYPLREHFSLSDAEIEKRVAEKLRMVGLEGLEDQFPAELSGGMKKRVALARAIATEPDVILYDEPTTGLDPINANRINHLIRQMQRMLSVTSIVVTHDMQSAFSVSDRIAMLYDRRIPVVDTVDNIMSSAIPEVRNFIEGRFEEIDARYKRGTNGQENKT
ncbi:MAG: ABC transporter ATP-binding protein [Pseudomonadota bacterium]